MPHLEGARGDHESYSMTSGNPTPTPKSRAELMARLDALGIASTTVEHEAVFTVAESDRLHREIAGGHTKNLFLKDAKDRLFLIVAECHTPIDLKALPKAIGSARLSFGRPELLAEVLGVTPGSVTALALINDPGARVSVVVDRRLMGYERINCHPLVNTATTSLARDDLLSFMRPEWVDAEGVGFFGTFIGFILSYPTPAWIAILAYIVGGVVINHTSFGRHVLAVGGGTEASRLMGLPVNRTIFSVYVISGALAGLAGVILASQFGAGQPIEGIGWELFAIASVVVGGTLLSGGKGSVAGTLAGALLLGVIFTILNFENGMGWISLSAYWQSVVRGLFLLVVVILQSRLAAKDQSGSPKAST